MTDAAKAAKLPLTPYQKKLFIFLSIATFFEGYDFIALTQILPELSKDLAIGDVGIGLMVSVINFGTVLAFFLVRGADRWGRRRMLTVTIAGYTVFTFGSGLAPDVYIFTVMQFVARMFLVAEYGISMVFAAEEFPANRRGMVIGVIQGCSSLGAIACAGLVPLLISKTPWGWRSVYFVGIIPLLVLAFARRSIKESKRYAEEVGEDGANTPLLHIWRTPHKKRMLQLALIWSLTFVCTHNAVTFWKKFVMESRGFDAEMVGLSISIAAVGSMPLVFYAGKLLDQIGRRKGAIIIFSVAIVGVLGSYGFHGRWPLTFSLMFGIFGASAVLPVLNAFTTELFPTNLRGDAFAWSNNLLGRIGYVISPAMIGGLAGALGLGLAVQLTVIGPALALVFMLMWLPETGNKDLSETATLGN